MKDNQQDLLDRLVRLWSENHKKSMLSYLILTALSKQNTNYIDENTKLFNSQKLKELIHSSNIDKLNFLVISIPTINEINGCSNY